MQNLAGLEGQKVTVQVTGASYTGLISGSTTEAYLVLSESEKDSRGGVTRKSKPMSVVIPCHLITAPIEIPEK